MADAVRVLLVTADDGLGGDVMRLAALAGGLVERQRASVALRAAWRAAEVVVVGLDVVVATATLGLPRRAGVIVVGTGEPAAAEWRASVELGAARVVALPAAERLVVELIAAAGEAGHGAGRVLGVIGGCGGAGASTLAAALALTAGGAGPTALIDADPGGGGLDLLLGAERRPGVRWPDLVSTRGRLDPEALASAMCQVAGITLLSHGRTDGVAAAAVVSPRVVSAVLDASRSRHDLVVVDLGRLPDEASEAALAASDALLIVVPATVRAVAAAASVVPRLAAHRGVAHAVVRDPGGNRLRGDDVSAGLGVPVVTSLRSSAAVAAAALRGDPPPYRRGSLRQACRAVIAATVSAGSAA